MKSGEKKHSLLRLNEAGWCEQATWMPSPNFDERPENSPVNLLVIHNISLPPGQFGGSFIADLFLNQLDYQADPFFEQLQSLRVSAHFLIRRDGSLLQFVSANHRAWHAGASSFLNRSKCNDFSIGIEVEGTDFEPFTEAQYKALSLLTDALHQRYPFTHITGHEHIAPGRKTDPGPFFDWEHYQQLLMSQKESSINNDRLIFPKK